MPSMFDAILMGQSTGGALESLLWYSSAVSTLSLSKVIAIAGAGVSSGNPTNTYAFSTDGGHTWSPKYVDDLYFGTDFQTRSVVYAASIDKFIASTDAWIISIDGTTGEFSSVHDAAPDLGGWLWFDNAGATDVLMAGTPGGLGISLNDAVFSGWSASGIDTSHQWYCGCSDENGRLYASGASVGGGSVNKVAYSDDGGATWTYVATGLGTGVVIHSMAYDPINVRLVIVGEQSGAAVCSRSTDYGATWVTKTLPAAMVVAYSVGVGQLNGGEFVVGGATTLGKGVIATAPTGDTWTQQLTDQGTTSVTAVDATSGSSFTAIQEDETTALYAVAAATWASSGALPQGSTA